MATTEPTSVLTIGGRIMAITAVLTAGIVIHAHTHTYLHTHMHTHTQVPVST